MKCTIIQFVPLKELLQDEELFFGLKNGEVVMVFLDNALSFLLLIVYYSA